jgi:glycosyltransferase involved in cell wall biosynthesis
MEQKEKVKNEIQLSVLVCTVTKRVADHLPKIISKLNVQSVGKPVEILYLGDNRKRSIGAKRNDLILLAQGDYACFIDDDDDIADDYIDSILLGIKEEPDVVVFQAMYNDINRNIQKPVKYSAEFIQDGEDANYFYRLPNHLMVFKSEILTKVWFKEINYGEDFDFAKQIKPYIGKQANVNKVLYYYNYDENLSESRK